MDNVTNWRKIVSKLILVAMFGAWSFYIYNNFVEIVKSLKSADIYLFSISLVILPITYFISILNWRKLLAITGEKITFITASRIWLLSNLAKYVPGTIWIPLSRGYYGKMKKIPMVNTLVSWFLEIYFLLLTSFMIILIFQSYSEIFLLETTIFLFILILLPLTHKKLLKVSFFFFSKIKKLDSLTIWSRETKKSIENLGLMSFLGLSIRYLLFWTVFGVWLFCLTSSISPYGSLGISFFIFSWALSWCIGYLVVFVPGGIGVREGILVSLFVSHGIPLSEAIIISILSRFQLVVMDGLLGAIFAK